MQSHIKNKEILGAGYINAGSIKEKEINRDINEDIKIKGPNNKNGALVTKKQLIFQL